MSDSLAHYGVPGMKWGKRRTRAQLKSSSDRKMAIDNHAGKHPKQLSNKQLKAANNRLQMEKQYKELTKQPGALDKIKRGDNAAKAIIGVASTGILAYNTLKNPAVQKLIKAGQNAVYKYNFDAGKTLAIGR